MVRIKSNKITQPETLGSRTTTMKNRSNTLAYSSLKKLRKESNSFVITVIDKNQIPKRVPTAAPSGFVVTENSSETDGNTPSAQPLTLPKLKCARGMYVGEEYVLRKTFSYFKDDGKEVTYFVDEPFNEEEDLEDDEFNTSRVDQVNESWNAAYSDIKKPETPRRISFGVNQDIVVDRVRWTPKALREARKGPWLKLAFTRKQSCPASWAVSES